MGLPHGLLTVYCQYDSILRMTQPAAILTDLVLEVFRLNGRLIASGDSLVAGIGLTSARWQVLGAIALQPAPAPVVRIADTMGLTRQSVQRIVDDLKKEGVVAFYPNPHHKRAKLVTLTHKGSALYEAAMRLQKGWATALCVDLDCNKLLTSLRLLKELNQRLEGLTGKGGKS